MANLRGAAWLFSGGRHFGLQGLAGDDLFVHRQDVGDHRQQHQPDYDPGLPLLVKWKSRGTCAAVGVAGVVVFSVVVLRHGSLNDLGVEALVNAGLGAPGIYGSRGFGAKPQAAGGERAAR
jgi:hypothetical protein